MHGDELQKRIGERLLRARNMRGLSLRALSKALESGLSHTAIQKIENGTLAIDSNLLMKFCGILNLAPDYFFRKASLELIGEVEFRKLAKFGTKAQNAVIEDSLEFFERYFEIEDILNISGTSLKRVDFDESKEDDQIEEFALELRDKWKLGLNPLPNVHMMLEENGIKVKTVESEASFNGFCCWVDYSGQTIPVVGLSKQLNNDLPRKRFTALHELGHLLIRFPDFPKPKLEKLCHRFAGAFLIPKNQFIDAFGGKRKKISVPELVAIKQEWGISMSAILQRAKALGLVSESYMKWMSIYFGKYNWNKVEPEFSNWAGSESSSRFKRLVYSSFSQGMISSSKASTLLGLSLNEFNREYDQGTNESRG